MIILKNIYIFNLKEKSVTVFFTKVWGRNKRKLTTLQTRRAFINLIHTFYNKLEANKLSTVT